MSLRIHHEWLSFYATQQHERARRRRAALAAMSIGAAMVGVSGYRMMG